MVGCGKVGRMEELKEVRTDGKTSGWIEGTDELVE